MKNITVHKFILQRNGDCLIASIPGLRKVCLIEYQESIGEFCVWAEVDLDLPMISLINFYLVGTGSKVPPGYYHISSHQAGHFVWHIYRSMGEL